MGYEELYKVSNLGQIFSLYKNIIRKTYNQKGYEVVDLRKNGTSKKYVVGVLVARAFLGPPPSKNLDVCHNNGISTDNRVENLRYDTRRNNNLDILIHGRHVNANKDSCIRGHLLDGLNLMPDQLAKGWRTCRACNRAASYIRFHPELDLQEISDLCYQHNTTPSNILKYLVKESQ